MLLELTKCKSDINQHKQSTTTNRFFLLLQSNTHKKMSRRESVTKAKLRTRRDSGTKLDHYYKIVNKTILSHQVSPYKKIFI